MHLDQIKAEINQLELAEKILLVEEVWDSIAANNSEVPLPEWQKKELDNRYAEFKKGKNKLHSSDSVHEELRTKYK